VRASIVPPLLVNCHCEPLAGAASSVVGGVLEELARALRAVLEPLREVLVPVRKVAREFPDGLSCSGEGEGEDVACGDADEALQPLPRFNTLLKCASNSATSSSCMATVSPHSTVKHACLSSGASRVRGVMRSRTFLAVFISYCYTGKQFLQPP